MNIVLEMPARFRSSRILESVNCIRSSVLFASLALCLALMAPSHLFAQGITGSIAGTVTALAHLSLKSDAYGIAHTENK
jgi:hypothetical protein